jgi:hypothetical protein
MRDKIKKMMCITLAAFLFISTTAIAKSITNNSILNENNHINEPKLVQNKDIFNAPSEDMDELVDLELTVTIKEIRALDTIDLFSKPDFYVKVFINGEDWWTTDTWKNQDYVKAYISNTIDVPDFEENVSIKIQLWDENPIRDKICDISGAYDTAGLEKNDIDLQYSLKTGHWSGDDSTTPSTPISDLSGYGRANGCDDNTYKIQDRDCEITFDITQNDYDGDGIPWWTEVYYFGTDPEVDDTGRDDDGDGVPIEWEYKWGLYTWVCQHHEHYEQYWVYNPFEWEDHENLDPDRDGLQNTEEYITSEWGSDPFCQDIFIELDQMEVIEGESSYFPDQAYDMFYDAYAKHNIVIHFDTHLEDEMTGGEIIPYEDQIPRGDHERLYNDYFLHDGQEKWRQGIFHYAVIVHRAEGAAGFAFNGGDESYPYADGVLITTRYHDEMSKRTIRNILNTKVLDDTKRKAYVYAGVMMHETGHVLGIHNGNTKGCDNRNSYTPKQIGWWSYAPYRSCMNYRYLFEILDYSDGSHGKNDWDDWQRIDLTRFQG